MKKIAEAKILSPTDYWEKKLNVKFDDELIPYKGLCIAKLSRKEKRDLIKRQYKTHTEWATYWANIFSCLDTSEKSELYYYFENRMRLSNTFEALSHSLLIPLITSICVSIGIPASIDYVSLGSAIGPQIALTRFIIALLLCSVFLWYCLKTCATTVRNEMLERNFYLDLKELLTDNIHRI